MPSLEDIENALPGGFHDAHVRSCQLDFAARSVSFELDLSVGNPDSTDSEERNRYRTAILKLEGLVAFTVDPPFVTSLLLPGVPLWIDLVRHGGDLLSGMDIPSDAFRTCFFVQNWNATVVIAARNAEFSWRASG